ncbi:hypothetical protein [Streptomyces sp. NPDC059092]|uniref:hypothetical protein n=1 Tax=Streptomyces sp. NPDC059092 TaxID=3346725 RepID=UPI003677BA84
MWSGQPPGGGGSRAKAAAIAAATTVVVGVGVTGSLLLGGDRDGNANGVSNNTKAPATVSKGTTASAPASGDPHGGETGRPTVPGWKAVVNPKWGTAFDVPPDWDVKPADLLIGFEDSEVDYTDPANRGKAIIIMGAPAVLQENWCLSQVKEDGRVKSTSTALAAAGTKGARGAKNSGDAALSQVYRWVYGGYTQPDTESIIRDNAATPYTTKSGIKGSIAWARSKNTPRKGTCASDGKAITFGFKDSTGAFVAWNLHGVTGVKNELPDSTIMKILSTVRLHGDPTES